MITHRQAARRNKRARAVHRLHSRMAELEMKLKNREAQLEGLGVKIDREQTTYETEMEKLHNRIGVLEKCPRMVRWLFGAK